MTCDEIRPSLGALALGTLDEDEARAVREHVAGCEECSLEYEELRGLPRLLGLVSLDEIAGEPPVPTSEGQDALLLKMVAERRQQRRRHTLQVLTGGLSVAAAAAVLGFVVADGTPVEGDEQPADLTLAATDQSTGVWAEVALNDVGWGTKISLELSGVEAGQTCKIVAHSSGVDETGGTWVVPASVKDYITIPGAVSAHLGEIDSFDIVSSSGETLVQIPRDAIAAIDHPHG